MAASISSSVSSSAPIDFKLINSVEDTSNAISVAVERCPLCSCSKRAFHCSKCLNKGDFIRSSQGHGLDEGGLGFGPFAVSAQSVTARKTSSSGVRLIS